MQAKIYSFSRAALKREIGKLEDNLEVFRQLTARLYQKGFDQEVGVMVEQMAHITIAIGRMKAQLNEG